MLLAVPLGTSILIAGEVPQYRFIEIPVPISSECLGVSDDGLVTGAYVNPATGGWTSFVLDRDKLTTGIEIRGATDTVLGPANIWGVESGNFGNETNQRPVFRDINRGTYAPLPVIPGMPYNIGNGINDFGHGVGVAYASGDINLGGNGLGMNWFWDGRHYSYFTVPGATYGATVGGINDWDQISGDYVDATGTPHGFVKDGSKYTTFTVPGAVATIGISLNNEGAVTGFYVKPDGSPHGFIWSNGQFSAVDANIPGSTGTSWIGINDRGDLAGINWDTNYMAHAVIALRLDGDGD